MVFSKHHLLLAIIITAIWPIRSTQAQKYGGDYIITDSAYAQGKVLPIGKGKIQFQKTKLDQPVIYTANEIMEYGYSGNSYELLTIKSERNFYRRIVQGENNLYVDNRSFILKRKDTLTLINKKNFRTVLPGILHVSGEYQALSRLSYSKISLRNFIDLCNTGQCSSVLLPHKKIGVSAGYNFFKFNISEPGSSEFYDNTNFISMGFFAEFPLYSPRSLYLVTEINWISDKSTFYNSYQNSTDYIAIDVSGLNAPFGFKWMFSGSKIRPFLKAGGMMSYLNINSPTGFVQTIITGSVVEISQREISTSSSFLFGYHSGMGIEIPLTRRKNIHIEVKYLKSFKGDFDSISLSFTGMYFSAGFNI